MGEFAHRDVEIGIVEDHRRGLSGPVPATARFRVGAAAAMISLPVALEPVKEMTSTSCEATIAWPTSMPFSVDGMDHALRQGGRASWMHCMMRRWISGVCGAGLMTTVQPAASAGASDPPKEKRDGRVPRAR